MGKLYVIVGPSGSGKSTLARLLCEQAGFREATSHTTRAIRPGEVAGVNYHYISVEEFERMQANDEFVETVIYQGSGKMYGVTRVEITSKLAKGDVVIVAEEDGAKQLADAFSNTMILFLMPPSPDELRRRMVARGDKLEDVEQRLQHVVVELDSVRIADEVISPGSIEEVYAQVIKIVGRYREVGCES